MCSLKEHVTKKRIFWTLILAISIILSTIPAITVVKTYLTSTVDWDFPVPKCNEIKIASLTPYKCKVNRKDLIPLNKWLDKHRDEYDLVALIRLNRHCTRHQTKSISVYKKIQDLFTKKSSYYKFLTEFFKNYSEDVIGKLTKFGEKEAFDLGSDFRNYYGIYLPNMDNLYVLAGCSGVNRACSTRSEFIKGLFGKKRSENSKIDFEIISQSYIEPSDFENTNEYKALKKEFDSLYQSDIKSIIQSNLKKQTPISFRDFIHIVNASCLEFVINGNDFWINILNLKIKNKMNEFKEKSREIKYALQESPTKELIYPLINLYIDNLERLKSQILDGKTDQQEDKNSLIFYFSHDTTMVAMLKALKLSCTSNDNITYIPFCSNIQFNLIKSKTDNGKIFIIASYDEYLCSLKDLCDINDDADPCDIDVLIQKMKEITA